MEPEPTTVAQASETGTSSHIVLVALSPVRHRDIRTWRFKRISNITRPTKIVLFQIRREEVNLGVEGNIGKSSTGKPETRPKQPN